VLGILDWFAEELFPDLSKISGASLATLSRTVMEAAHRLLQEQVLVVFLDHAHEADWALLGLLEDYLLGPLAIEPNTLILLSGRGRLYRWKTPELGLKAKFIVLKPFTEDQTGEQFIKQELNVANLQKIYQITGGNPLGNLILGKYDNFQAGLSHLASTILEVVPEEQRDNLREYMEALCVLRVIDAYRIPKLLATYKQDPKLEDMDYNEANRVLDQIKNAGFARYDNTLHGFVMDQLVRTIFESYIKETELKTWKRLHEAAIDLYQYWLLRYPKGRQAWQDEIDYHQKALSGNENL
jgi:hypothetical protein